MKKNNSIFRGGLFLAGAIIGIGFLAIPYVVYRVGLFRGLVFLGLFGLLCWLLNMAYAQVVLVDKENFQLSGYGQKYWGWPGRVLGGLAVLVNANGAMLAYLIGLGNFLHFLFPANSSFFWVLTFWLIALGLAILGLKIIIRVGSLATLLLIFLVFAFLAWGITEVNLSNFTASNQESFILVASVFFFAYAGFTVIPEVGEIVNFDKKTMLRAITLGSLLPIILYSLFAGISLGILGDRVSEEFVFGLSHLSFFWSRLVAVMAILTIISSFFAFSFVLREFWNKDFGWGKTVSLGLAFLPSLLLYLLGFRDFITVISLTGGISCLLVVIVILFCWLKERASSR